MSTFWNPCKSLYAVHLYYGMFYLKVLAVEIDYAARFLMLVKFVFFIAADVELRINWNFCGMLLMLCLMYGKICMNVCCSMIELLI